MAAPSSFSDFHELLAAAHKGDHDALGELFQIFRRILKHRVRKQMHRRLQGKLFDSDIVQDAFCAAFQQFAEFNGETAPQFLAWLESIADHKLHDAEHRFESTAKRDVRRERYLSEAELAKRVLQSPPSRWEDPAQASQNEEVREKLRRALRSLSLRLRLAIRVREQFPSMREAADAMGLTHQAFRRLHARAIRELKRDLTPHS